MKEQTVVIQDLLHIRIRNTKLNTDWKQLYTLTISSKIWHTHTQKKIDISFSKSLGDKVRDRGNCYLIII